MKKRSWTTEQLIKVAAKSTSVRQVIKALGLKPAGGNYSQIKKFLKLYKVKVSHFTGQAWNKGMRGIGIHRIALDKILTENSNFQSFKLKSRLYNAKLKNPECELCGWNKKSADGRIPLELDHINGNRLDNRLINLRILCPNCHSLQPTHRGLNRNKH
ncbi:MAG: HNH endonuclease signature motif containing protein [Candidatus Komeilibacteria bacterium]|nr:HNH endonuclease signature motif containing protein [Candidatus Komeilibacteria bacterium]